MSAANTANWIRTGLLALPVYGLLTFVDTLTHEHDRDTDFEAYARYKSTTWFFVSHLVGSIGGTILAIFATLALATYLAGTRAGRLALSEMVSG